MEITNQDEAKAEVERLLIAPIQIGSTWLCRSQAPRSVVVQGIVKGKVHVRPYGEDNKATYYIVDFHVAFRPLHFE